VYQNLKIVIVWTNKRKFWWNKGWTRWVWISTPRVVKVQSHYSVWHQRMLILSHTLIYVRSTLGIRLQRMRTYRTYVTQTLTIRTAYDGYVRHTLNTLLKGLLWAINNLFGTYREYIFWCILQYVSVLCYYFILFDDKILLDIKIFNK